MMRSWHKVRRTHDEEAAQTLIIFIKDINSFNNTPDQDDRNLGLRIFCILCKGEQPFFFRPYFGQKSYCFPCFSPANKQLLGFSQLHGHINRRS